MAIIPTGFSSPSSDKYIDQCFYRDYKTAELGKHQTSDMGRLQEHVSSHGVRSVCLFARLLPSSTTFAQQIFTENLWLRTARGWVSSGCSMIPRSLQLPGDKPIMVNSQQGYVQILGSWMKGGLLHLENWARLIRGSLWAFVIRGPWAPAMLEWFAWGVLGPLFNLCPGHRCLLQDSWQSFLPGWGESPVA